MKKILSLILALSLCFSLSACGNSGAPESQPPAASSAATSSNDSGNESGGIEVDENLLTVDITLPASLFENEDMSAFDAGAYAAEQGFNKAVLNDDGSVSINMSKSKHNELMSEMTQSVEDSFASMVQSEDTPYITEIRHSASFDAIDVVVDKAGYEGGGLMAAFIPFTVYFQAAFYQAFAGAEQHCEIAIIDSATGDTIESVVYPDALNNAG